MKRQNKILLGVILIYLATRLVFLARLPIFNDEAIYLDWGNRMATGGVSFFYPLFDGKTPLLIWIFGLFAKVFSDPLIPGRVVSVIAGAITLLGIYKAAEKLLGKSAAILSCLFYIATPIFAFYDRQALMEASISTVGVWAFYFLLRYLEGFKVREMVFLALVLTLGFYIKPSAAIFLIPLILILSLYFIKAPQKRVRILNGFVVFFLICFVLMLPLLVQKDFQLIFSRSERYIGSPFFFKNLVNLFEIFFWQVFLTTFALSLVGLKQLRKNFVFVVWIVIPIISTVFISNMLQPRYVVSFLPLIVLAAAKGFESLPKSLKGLAFLPIIPLLFLILNPYLYLSLLSRVISTSELEPYYLANTSGEGINKVRKTLEGYAQNTPIFVGVRLDAGNPESAMFAYYGKGKNKKIQAIYFDSRMMDVGKMEKISTPYPLYFVSRGDNLAGMNKYLEEAARVYNKGGNFIGIYRLKK